MASEIKVDTISEKTSAGGVTIDGLLIKDGNISGDVALAGTTPTFTIGDAGAEDAALVFDGNAQDFYIALDDSADDLVIGLGSTVGTTPAISINEDRDVTISDGAIDFDVASHDGTNGLKLGGTLVTATAAEINLIDGGTSRGTTAIADGDGVLINDAGTMRMTTVQTLATYIGGSDPSSADGDTLGTASVEWSDLYLADGGQILFGNDQEITLTHSADSGLLLKHTATADDKPINLVLQTGETDMAADDVIGKISFQAPDEGTGTDAVLVSAAIQAVAEGDHSSSSNATRLEFHTGASELATQKLQITSDGRGLSQFTAKAWIQFDGSGTPAAADSHNFGSITDNGTGDYTIAFSNDLANANYAVAGLSHLPGTSYATIQVQTHAAGSVRVYTVRSSWSLGDNNYNEIIIFGD